jgi:hypothetical protein
MASIIDVSELTLNPEEARDIASIIVEKGLLDGNLAKNHEIVTGIDHKQQIPFAGQIADSLAKADGCTPNTGSSVIMTEKFWEPVIYDTRFTHCQADLSSLLKLFQRAAKINPDFYDRIDSQQLGVVYALVTQMLNDAIPTKIWFSDKNAEWIDDGGVFTDGVNLNLYNAIDGLWKQIFTEVSTGDSNYTLIEENDNVDYASQALGYNSAFQYLASVYNAADSRLLQDPTAKFQVTRSIADNYRNYIRQENLGAGFLEVITNGVPQLFFDGIAVEVRHDWDRDIKALQNNGSRWNLPHRIVLTTPANIPVGTMSTDDLQTLDSFYDRTLKSNIIDVAFSLDAKLLEKYMISVAY